MSQPPLTPRSRAEEGIVMSNLLEHQLEAETMRAYIAGDEQAFSTLFRSYAPVLTGYFLRRGQRAHDVSDLVQQTFLQLHRARHEYRPGEPLRPWLFTIARNVSCDLLRRRQRRPETCCDFDDADAPHTDAPDSSRGDRMRALSAALERLPPASRALLTEHWFEDRDWTQIATREGMSAATLRVRAHRACAELRRWFESTSFELA
jgi:RNA polymerase sigma-70 factor, ECF subfamily